jgi:group II intron reverse transcriptase/maturase
MEQPDHGIGGGKGMETQNSDNVSTKLRRIAEVARAHPNEALKTLSHHIDLEWMKEAYARTRKDGAAGVDGETAKEFAENLEERLASLLQRFRDGTYFAPPVRRVRIPKDDGERLIGIPAFEDKVLQRAVTMVLEAVYEQSFLDCSYGFRPRRSAHQALEALWRESMQMGGAWILEVDIKSYFDSIDKAQLGAILDQRVKDGVIRRVIGKWLNAGVMEEGALRYADLGTPQGGVASPMLANIFLHEVLDVWFEREVKPRLECPATLIRFADDFVAVLRCEQDARRLMAVLPKRLAKYGLQVHPEKTRLVQFHRPRPDGRDSNDDPGTFTFLGFTHYWGKSKKATWVVKRKTAKRRSARAVRRIWEWCRAHRHEEVAKQQDQLNRKLRGHYEYYGLTGNFDALSNFAFRVRRAWRYWLDRRSQRARMTWKRFNALLKRHPLARPRITHSACAAGANP